MKRDYTLSTAARAFDILENLSQSECSIEELSQRTQIPKSTLFRYITTLEERGYVRRKVNGKLILGFKLLELSNRALAQMTIHELALPYMRDLQERFNETINLAVFDDNQVVYIEILESKQPFKMSSQIGSRDYPHCTALGKAILAFLDGDDLEEVIASNGLPQITENTITSVDDLQRELEVIRRRGFSIDNGENEEGVRCVGVPIFDGRGDVVAGMSFSGPVQHLKDEVIESMGIALVNVSKYVSKELGYNIGN